MMQAITLATIPSMDALLDEPCTDTDLIAAYLKETRGWPYEVGVEQSIFYRIDTRDEFYSSLQEDEPVEIDSCVRAWIYTPMEVYLITSL